MMFSILQYCCAKRHVVWYMHVNGTSIEIKSNVFDHFNMSTYPYKQVST